MACVCFVFYSHVVQFQGITLKNVCFLAFLSSADVVKTSEQMEM